MNEYSSKTNDELLGMISRAPINKIAGQLKDSLNKSALENPPPRFALFLGAGASVQSGIKLASQMMHDFREKIIERNNLSDKPKAEQDLWFNNNVFFKPGGNNYSKLFECFEPTEIGRQRYIKDLVYHKKPSFGYVILAGLMERHYINVILTTNFDDLLYRACTNFIGIRPLIYSWGILDSELQVSSRQSKILKMHGDFSYSQLANTSKELQQVTNDPNMAGRVIDVLMEYELIVLGYSGLDESVMKILAEYPGRKELYWCCLKGTVPNRAVLEFLAAKHGTLVEIDGFDEAMFEIYQLLGFNFDVLKRFWERIEFIFKEIHKFDRAYSTNVLTKAIDAALEQFKEYEETDFLGSFRSLNEGEKAFLDENYSEAEEKFIDAIRRNPKYSGNHYALGRLHETKGDDPTAAEKCYRNAIKVDPLDDYGHNRLGVLVARSPGREHEAEEHFNNAMKINPDNTFAMCNLGKLLSDLPERLDEAERLYLKAIKTHPDFIEPYHRLYDLYKRTCQEEKRRDLSQRIRRINRTSLFKYLIDLAVEYDKRGDVSKAIKLAAKIKKLSGFNNPHDLTKIYSILKKKSKTNGNLETVDTEEFSEINFARNDSVF
jgi:tetratricopeptide (TPR) repeat protein